MLAKYHKQWSYGRYIVAVMLVLLLGIAVSAGAALANGPTESKGASPALGTRPDCSPNWEVVPGVALGTDNGLRDVEALSSSEVWALGSYYDSGVGRGGSLFERWDGSMWTQMPDPDPIGVSHPQLKSFAPVSASDIWVVGDQELSGSQVALIVRWNGSEWAEVPSPHPGTISRLEAVEAVSAIDIWAVGEYWDGNNLRTLIVHWDGNYWQQVPSPSPGGSNQLWDLAAISSGDIWAVGNYFTQSPDAGHTMALHWDGNEWTQVPSPSPGTYLENLLFTVDGVSANDVWAAGSYTDSGNNRQLLMIHWDGSAWTQETVSSPNTSISDIVMVSANDVWAVGSSGYAIYGSSTLILHWNGSYWGQVPSPSPGAFANGLSAVIVISARDLWAVGYYNEADMQPSHALIERYNPCEVTPTPTITPTRTPTPITFSDVNPPDYFYEAVMYLAGHGAISGYADGTFRPFNNTTRGQLAKIIVLAEGWPLATPTGTPTFSDVPADHPFYSYIETAVGHSIISGYADGSFRPGNNVTRGQLCKIVVLAEGWPTYIPTSPAFTDVPRSHTFYAYIETAYNKGVISGYSCGTSCLEFRPGNNATRGQISKIVYNAVTSP